MANQINYQKEMDKLLAIVSEKEEAPILFLHSCCGPCSSYVLEYLSNYFRIIVYYYNPNIFPEEEYYRRSKEQENFINGLTVKYPITFIEGDYQPDDFYRAIKGKEHIKEGGERCFSCFRLRLLESAELAKQYNADYFATTLTISPMKNAAKINEIGEEIGQVNGIKYLGSDFKKKNGYKRSIELSNEFGLYRQDYCGCVYSQKERMEQIKPR